MSSYQSFVPLRLVVLGMNRSWGEGRVGKEEKKKKRRRKRKIFFYALKGRVRCPQSTSSITTQGRGSRPLIHSNHPFLSDTKPISSHLTNESVYSPMDADKTYCRKHSFSSFLFTLLTSSLSTKHLSSIRLFEIKITVDDEY